MYISDFARLGQVSMRMLRHYDDLGLLTPDHVDPGNGYRSYSPEQLHVLNRLVALKDLGFTLDQVRRIMVEDVGPDELRGMLRLRRIELEDEARAVGTRLAAVESRLRMIDKETIMSADFVIKALPAVRLVAQTANLEPEQLDDHIGPMFASVAATLPPVPGSFTTPIATYAETDSGMDVVVGYAYHWEPPPGSEVVDLPAVEAVCGVHLGSMATIRESWQALHRWIVENGHTFDGPCRELYVRTEGDDQSTWVTELQQPIRR
ncbi:MAG TPA: MerR family transcriptional regulator [Propionibacteriaceae bacterium]|nr:MerR family transcriptional regulator [Micropruina sp.]HBY24216.1 MerR family transcriptional regulator [Propionibacteriaceae bacterium]